MNTQTNLSLRNLLIILFLVFSAYQLFYSPGGKAPQPSATAPKDKNEAITADPAVASKQASPDEQEEKQSTPVSAEAREAYNKAASLAQSGDLTATAEALHDVVQEQGFNAMEQIYRDSRFKDFLFTRQHADLLLILGEEPSPEKGFPPIYFKTPSE